MFKHKVIELLKSYSVEEINDFRKFLRNGYFNKSAKLILFYEELIKFYPHFNNARLSKTKLYFKICKNESYNDSTFRNLCFDLQQLIFKFLVHKQLENKIFTSKNFLLKELSDRGQFNLIKRSIKKMENEFDKCMEIDFDYFHEKFVFESYKYNYLRQTGKVLNKSQSINQILQLSHASAYLTLMYFTELVCEYINAVIFSDKYNIELKNNFISVILTSIDLKKLFELLKNNVKYEYVVDLYISLYSAYQKLNKVKYLEYKNLVKKYYDKLSSDEKSFHYSRLISFCIIKNNKNTSPYFANELFTLYEFFLTNGLYVNKKTKYIPPNLFRAILQLALSFKKYNWAKNFIVNYYIKIPEKYRLHMFHYGYALLYSVNNKYKSALKSVSKIDFDDFIFKYDLYTLKLKIYFDYKSTSEVLDLIKSYKEFLRKDKLLTEDKKILHKNFVKYLTYLVNCKDGIKNYTPEELKAKLADSNTTTSKDWLIEKLEELEKQDIKKIKYLLIPASH